MTFGKGMPIVWPMGVNTGDACCRKFFSLVPFYLKESEAVTLFGRSLIVLLLIASAGIAKAGWSENSPSLQLAQADPSHSSAVSNANTGSHDMGGNMDHNQKSPSPSALKPAEGASVKILSPKQGQSFKGDQVAIQFKLVKGKRGHHVHAYVDNQLMGMFEGEKGTLNGIKPGSHVLKLRVVADDHQTELDASDEARFTVK